MNWGRIEEEKADLLDGVFYSLLIEIACLKSSRRLCTCNGQRSVLIFWRQIDRNTSSLQLLSRRIKIASWISSAQSDRNQSRGRVVGGRIPSFRGSWIRARDRSGSREGTFRWGTGFACPWLVRDSILGTTVATSRSIPSGFLEVQSES